MLWVRKGDHRFGIIGHSSQTRSFTPAELLVHGGVLSTLRVLPSRRHAASFLVIPVQAFCHWLWRTFFIVCTAVPVLAGGIGNIFFTASSYHWSQHIATHLMQHRCAADYFRCTERVCFICIRPYCCCRWHWLPLTSVSNIWVGIAVFVIALYFRPSLYFTSYNHVLVEKLVRLFHTLWV